MSQAAHEHAPRISQILPTVKCSTCGQPVPLANLGDHVCPPLPSPSLPLPGKPPPSSTPLPQRLQSLIARPSSEEGERGPTPGRDPVQRPLLDNNVIPLDSRPAPARPPPPPPDHLSTNIPPTLQRVRTPSNTAQRSPSHPAFPVPFAEPRLPAFVRRGHPPPPPSTPTTPPSVSREPSERARTLSAVSTSRSSLHKSRPSLGKLGSSPDVHRPSSSSQRSSTSVSPGPPISKPPSSSLPAPGPSTVPFPSCAPIPAPLMTVRQPPPPPLSLVSPRVEREIDTKIGGEAGMAGVGRRGFAAAARAAMFAATLAPSHHPAHIKILGDGHRANIPQYLDTSATFTHVMRAAITPPLSPNSAYTPSPVSPFPASPISLGISTPISGRHPDLPSPHDVDFRPSSDPPLDDKTAALPFPSSEVRIASPSRSPSPIPNPFERRVSGETITQSPMPTSSLPLPFLDVLRPELDPANDSDEESVYTTHSDLKKDQKSPSSPPTDEEVGLAYVNGSDDDTPVVLPLDIRKSDGNTYRVKFSASLSSGQVPSRQTSASSLRSAMSSRLSMTSSRSASATTQSTARSTGALERAMETLIEEGASVSVLASGSVLASIGGTTPARGSGKPSRSKTVPGPASPEQKPPKLPTRSHTNPSLPHVHSERVGLTGEVVRIRNKGSTKRRVRVCAGCNSKIEDGRWIQMDGGNVLCERCWKNMYLPKCRRCNLPIEKQAVSSRDGQLKGKYHKECFNCHTCQKPFPDKEFYVFDEKPFCAYHYHEANDSLCGAHSCGQPIEGPCAVTHSGKRYHPEHLLCEFEGGCEERLEEYWEVDGEMLCERHATFIGSRDSGWMQEDDLVSDIQTKKEPGTDEGRMMKRMTRFIDLGTGGEDALDIR